MRTFLRFLEPYSVRFDARGKPMVSLPRTFSRLKAIHVARYLNLKRTNREQGLTGPSPLQAARRFYFCAKHLVISFAHDPKSTSWLLLGRPSMSTLRKRVTARDGNMCILSRMVRWVVALLVHKISGEVEAYKGHQRSSGGLVSPAWTLRSVHLTQKVL